MSNAPWECPRCRRINAPFNPTCFCPPNVLSNSGEVEIGYLKKKEKERPLINTEPTPKPLKSNEQLKYDPWLNVPCVNCGRCYGSGHNDSNCRFERHS